MVFVSFLLRYLAKSKLISESISSPQLSQPSALFLANNSILGKSPTNSIILSLTQSGFCEWLRTGLKTSCDTFGLILLGLPLIANKQGSLLALVHLPNPKNNPSPDLFYFTH